MLTENTVTKLQEMHLSAMAKAFKDQLTNPNMAGMSFEDRFGLLVDQEWTTRKNNHLNRLIKSAGFAEPNACVEDIEYHADRKLDKTQIARLACCDYITDHHNIMLLGATGSGKTYLACALGMAAVRKFLTVKYVRLPELLTELAIARSNGTYRKVIQQYKKPALLILDEWLLYPLKEPRREIYWRLPRQGTRRPPPSSARNSKFLVGGIRSGTPFLQTPSVTVLSTTLIQS